MRREQRYLLTRGSINQAPKYRCPQCHCCTCSVQCYKRHQQWSQCSGKRDPGAFVKKSQLSTPAGIDHDYNFLTAIDKVVDIAGRSAKDRGIILQHAGSKAQQKCSSFQQHLEMTRVRIHRAPTGMSREKVNQTRWHPKHKCILWTLEWIHPDQSKELGQCRETSPLSTTYHELLLQKRSSKKRKTQGTESYNSSKLPLSPAVTIEAGEVVHPNAPLNAQHRSTDIHENYRTSSQYYFYLVKPFTSGLTRVLVPVSPSYPLASCLGGNEIFEFPTIQVLGQPPTSLPKGFDLEEEYVVQTQNKIPELNDDLGKIRVADIDEKYHPEENPQSWDQDWFNANDLSILESLQRDIDG